MTAAPRKSSENESVARNEPRFSKALEDRIPADGEQVSHILDPDRTPDTVRYPDPQAPFDARDAGATSAQSNADIQMARRTDAGPAMAADRAQSAQGSSMLVWFAGAAALVLLVVVLIAVL